MWKYTAIIYDNVLSLRVRGQTAKILANKTGFKADRILSMGLAVKKAFDSDILYYSGHPVTRFDSETSRKKSGHHR